MSDLSASFSNWSDRITYIVAEAQLLVAGALVALGIGLYFFGVSLPGIPEWLNNLVIGWLVLGPPAFVAGLRFVAWLRTRQWVEVHHVNAAEDIIQTHFVPPEVWAAKRVDGPAPYRVNDNDDFAVQEYEWAPEYGENGQLVVQGVHLSELEDTKLYTSQRHMERSYEELVDSHLSLAYIRDSISELSASLQTRLINEVAYAREHGEQLDQDAVQEVTEEFREEAEKITEAEITDLSPEDVDEWAFDALPAGETHNPNAGAGIDTEPSASKQTATDGGTQE